MAELTYGSSMERQLVTSLPKVKPVAVGAMDAHVSELLSVGASLSCEQPGREVAGQLHNAKMAAYLQSVRLKTHGWGS